MAIGTELMRLFVRIGADTSELKGALNDLDSAVSNMGNRLQRAGSTFTQAGMALTAGLTVPIVGLGVVAAKASIDFESAFAGVKKTVEATDEQFAQMRQGIRDMAKEMPASATAISKVAESAGQLGIAREDILSFTETMIKVGTATNLSADEAATAFARLANIMQIPIEDVDNLASALVELGNNGASTESEIVEMALRIAGAGHQVGLSGEEVLAFANALSSVGIEAESGGTAISRAFIQIANDVADGGERLDEFARVAGMTTEEFARAFKTDAAGAMIAFIEGLKRVSDSGENVFQTLDDLKLGEIRVRDALLRASGAGDLFRQSLDDGARAMQQNIALDVEYEKRKETTAAKLEILKNHLIDVAITLGDALIPALIKAIDAAEPFFKAIEFGARAFAALPQPVQFLIIALAGLAAVIGPLLIMVGAMVTGFGAISAVFGVVAAAAGLGTVGIGGMAAAFGALLIAALPWVALAAVIAGGLYLLIKNWDDVTAAVSRAATVVRDVLVSAFNKVLSFLSSNWPEVATLIAGPFAPVVALATDAFGIRSALIDAFADVIDFMSKVPGYIVRALGDLGDLLYNAGKAIIYGLWKGMADAAVGMLNWVSNLAGKIASLKGPLSKDRRLLIPQGQAIIEGLATGMDRGFRRTLKPLIQDLTETLQSAWSGVSLDAPMTSSSTGSRNLTSRYENRAGGERALVVQDDDGSWVSPATWAQRHGVPLQNMRTDQNGRVWIEQNTDVTKDNTKALSTTSSILASTGDSVSSGLMMVGDSAGKTAKTLDSLSKSTKKLTGSTNDMVKAEDGSMVPKSFYDKLDLTPVKRPSTTSAPKTTKAEDGSTVPASFYDQTDYTPVVRKNTDAVKDATKANDGLAASLEKVDAVAPKAADSIEDVGQASKTSASSGKGFGLSLAGIGKTLGKIGGLFDGLNLRGGLQNLSRDIGEGIGGLFEGLTSGIGDQAGALGETVKNGISGAFSGAGDFFGSIGEGIGNTVSGAFETAKTAAGEGISGLIAFIGENFTAYRLGQAVGWFFLWPAAVFREAMGLAASVATTFFVATLPNLILNTIPGVMSAMMNLGISISTGLVNGLASAMSQLTNFFMVTLPTTIVAAAASIAPAALAIGTSIVSGIASGIAGASQSINVFVRQTLPAMISGGASAVANAAVQIGKSIASGIYNGWTGASAAVVTFARQTFPAMVAGAISGGFAALQSVWNGIGKAIAAGIWEGLSSMFNWMKTQVSNFVKGLANAAKSALNIRSPSKVFAEIGQNIVAGLALGIRDRGPEALGQLTSLLTGMTSSRIPGFAMPTSLTSSSYVPMGSRLADRSATTSPSNSGLTIQAYGTVVNNFDKKQDANKALGDIAYMTAAELRSRGVLI